MKRKFVPNKGRGAPAPEHLHGEAAAWWKAVNDEFDLDDSHSQWLLLVAAEAFGRLRDAQQIVKKEGLCVTTSRGVVSAHPMLRVERETRSQLLQALRHLCLDATGVPR